MLMRLLWIFLFTLGLPFFIIPNLTAISEPAKDALASADQSIYFSLNHTRELKTPSLYTEDFCLLSGYKYIKNKSGGYCDVELPDKGRICYSGFQCISGECVEDEPSPWYIKFGPGSCAGYEDMGNTTDTVNQKYIRFGIRL